MLSTGVKVVSQGIVRRHASAAHMGNVLWLGLLGLLSGILVWGVISIVWESYIGLDRQFDLAGWAMSLTHVTLVPGILFGMTVALFLSRRGLARPWQVFGYIAASTVSNFIAANFAANMVNAIESAAVLGMLAGLVGAGCLTALSLLMFPFLRRAVPCAMMIAAGTLLGSLLYVALEDGSNFGLGFLVFYALWQAGYAAAFGVALPPRQQS